MQMNEQMIDNKLVKVPTSNKRGYYILNNAAIPCNKVLLLTGTPFVNEIYDEFKKKSYCRIALRGLSEDAGFFEMQKKNIPATKLYHFILNSNYKETLEIRNIFSVIKINNTGYKIGFIKS